MIFGIWILFKISGAHRADEKKQCALNNSNWMWPDYVKQVAYIAANISKVTVDYCYRIGRYSTSQCNHNSTSDNRCNQVEYIFVHHLVQSLFIKLSSNSISGQMNTHRTYKKPINMQNTTHSRAS